MIPSGATHINIKSKCFYRVCGGVVYICSNTGCWLRSAAFNAGDVCYEKGFHDLSAWPSDDRIDNIGQNGNTGENYSNKYQREVKGVTVDVYDVLKAFNVTCPALQHLIKKALCAGLRGHKDVTQDLQDIIDSANRAMELSSEYVHKSE